MNGIFKVVHVGQIETITSRKDESTTSKRTIRLKEIGNEFSNEYTVTLFGEKAERTSYGQIVAADLRFLTHQNQFGTFQDVIATEIITLKQ
jgi:hypothetical protein